jgi:hypothetical protein
MEQADGPGLVSLVLLFQIDAFVFTLRTDGNQTVKGEVYSLLSLGILYSLSKKSSK